MRTIVRSLLAASLSLMAAMAPADAQSPSPTSVHVVTYLDISPAQMGKATLLLRDYRDYVSKSPGNSGLEFYHEVGRIGRVVIRETWDSQSAFEANNRSTASTGLELGLKPLQLAPADQRVHLDFASGNGIAKQTGSSIFIFTHVDVPPPRQAELEPMLRQIQAASVKVATAVRYEVLQQVNRKNHFTVAEVWSNYEALRLQAVSVAQREYRHKLNPMLGALYDERHYRILR